jgi:hypothetical protein
MAAGDGGLCAFEESHAQNGSTTLLLIAAILLVGIVAFRELPVSAMPEVDYPTMLRRLHGQDRSNY